MACRRCCKRNVLGPKEETSTLAHREGIRKSFKLKGIAVNVTLKEVPPRGRLGPGGAHNYAN